ncbi:ester cyclase [Flavitalea antarctica]
MEAIMIAHPNLPVIVSEYEQKWVEGLNNGDVSVANEVFHHDCIVHINGNTRRDLTVEQFTEMVAGLFVAFPDLHFTIEDQFSSGHKFSTRWTATGSNTGPFGDMPATGKKVEIEGHIIDYVVDGKVAKRWEIWDQMAMMQQLGLA